MSTNSDVAQLITGQIIEALEKSTIPWKKPWKTELPMNLMTKHGYRGINLLLLSLAPYANPYYLTFKQASAIGGFIKKGERGYRIVYWTLVDDSDSNTDQDERSVSGRLDQEARKKPFLRYYTVFNVEQCGKIPERLIPQLTSNNEPIKACEAVVSSMPNKPKIILAGQAYYEWKTDTIGIPSLNQFISGEEYYSTLFHELVHSTGHPGRLNRKSPLENGMLKDAYSKEELIAELGNAFLCAHVHILPKTIDNQASYIAHWLDKLKSDKRLIFSAASADQKASDYILGKPEMNMKPAEETTKLNMQLPEPASC